MGIESKQLTQKDLENMPKEILEKLQRKGSFSKPSPATDTPNQKTGGIGSKASENQLSKKDKKQQEEDDSYEKAENAQQLVRIATKIFNKSKLDRLIKLIEEPENVCGQLGIKFTDEDIDMLLFKGEVEKEIDIFKNGKVVAKFKSLKKSEREEVDRMCNEAIREKKIDVHTQGGLDKYRAKRLLAYSLVGINGDDLTSFDQSFEYLTSASDWIYEYLISNFNLYIFAVSEALNQESIKNA